MIADKLMPHIAAILVAAIACAGVDASEPGDPPTSAAAADHYTVAAAHFQRARWSEAVAAFDEFLAAAPADAPLVAKARFYRAEALLRDGKASAAADAFLKYLESPSEPDLQPTALFRAGEACYLMDRFQDARRLLEQLLAEFPHTPTAARAWFYLGDASAMLGDSATAADAFAVLTAAYPEDPLFERAALAQARARLSLNDAATAATIAVSLSSSTAEDLQTEALWIAAESAGRLGRDVQAAADFLTFVTRRPQDDRAFDALVAAARLQAKAGRKAEAARSYRRAAVDYPQHPRREVAIYEEAWTLIELGLADDATSRFRVLHDECRGASLWADATYRLAESTLRRGDDAAAMKLAAESAAKADGELLPHVLLLEAQAALGAEEFAAAEAACRRLAERFPEHELRPAAEYWAAETAFRRGDSESAVAQFTALTTNPRLQDQSWMPTVWLRLAQAQAELHHWREAVATAAEALRRFPQFEQAYEFDFLCGRAHAAQAEFTEAREAYRRVLSAGSAQGTETAALAQFMIAESHFHQRDYEAALAEYFRIGALHAHRHWQAAALLQAGKCRERLGQTTEAIVLYEQLLAEHADDAFAAEASTRKTALTAATATAPQPGAVPGSQRK